MGGYAVFWTCVLSDERNIQNRGNKNGSISTTIRTYVQALTRSPLRDDPFTSPRSAPHLDQQQAHAEHQREQDHEQRARVADVEVEEADLEGVDVQRLRGEAGPALRHHVDVVERLEAVDGAEQERHDDRRPQQGQRDAPEHLRGRGAVDLRRLVRLERQRGETCERDQRDERRPLPGVHHHERRDDDRRVAHPLVGTEPHQPDQVVHDAERRVVHHHPHERDRHRRRHHRQQEDRSHQPLATERPVQEERERDAEHDLEQRRKGGEVHRETERVPETVVLDERASKVAQADPFRRGDAAREPGVHAHVERVEHRKNHQHEDDGDGGEGEDRRRVALDESRPPGAERRQAGTAYFFSVSAMMRFTSVAALFAAALTSPPWIAVTMAAPIASRHSATATTGGFHSGVPTFEPTVSDSRRSAGTFVMPFGSFHTASRAPSTPFSLWTASTCSLAVAHCMNSQAAFWFLLLFGIARPQAATVDPYWPFGPRGKSA